MSGFATTRHYFKKSLGKLYVSASRTDTCSFVNKSGYWYDLYVLFGRKVEINVRWK